MGCIRVDKITEYLCEPLRKCLKDEDPYVRKTAAVAVAKLHDINANLVEEQGFLDSLRDLLGDSNPMVVANAVAALSEINESSSTGQPLIEMNTTTINKLLTALNECTEWGQVFILDSLSSYNPKDDREAQSICERITPRLAHANAAVVLSAVKVCCLLSPPSDGGFTVLLQVLMKYMEMMGQDTDFVNNLVKVSISTLCGRLFTEIITETVAPSGDPPVLGAGGAVRGSQEHQSHHSEEAGHPQARDESLLREVQRPNLHQAGEARHHDQTDQPGQHRPGVV